MELDFEVDKITESIEDAATGESFETLVLPVLNVADLKGVSKKSGWQFDWRKELRQPERHVYKLVTENEPTVIHGLISLEAKNGYVEMYLIESAPFNLGNVKKYLGVSFNLIAYVCKLSKDLGFGGVVAFESKTKLMDYYEKKIGAERIGGRRMAIFEEKANFYIRAPLKTNR